MLQNGTKRELLEQLIVAELISRRGEGPLARRHFPMAGRGPAGGPRPIARGGASGGSPGDVPRPEEPG